MENIKWPENELGLLLVFSNVDFDMNLDSPPIALCVIFVGGKLHSKLLCHVCWGFGHSLCVIVWRKHVTAMSMCAT